MSTSTTSAKPRTLTDQSAIRKRFSARALRDLKAIVTQVLRFSRMAPKEVFAYMHTHPGEAFHSIPHPHGHGMIFCGGIGFNRFCRLAELILEFDPTLERRVQMDVVRKVLIDFFVSRILKEKRELDTSTSSLILDDVVTQLQTSLRDTDHFLPCVLFQNGGPDQFSVGPVKFTRTRKFFREKRQALHDSLRKDINAHIAQVAAWAKKKGSTEGLMNEADSERFLRNLQARAFKTYRAYPWIAEVKVLHCDKETAEVLSVKAADAALHVIRLLLGTRVTRRVRLAWSRGDTLRTAGMWANTAGHINISISSNGMAPVGTENWHDGLTRGNGHPLAILGSAIAVLSNPRPIFHLHQRFLDSIHWFGDAATESEPTSQIIKYTSGIERLIFGSFERGQKTEFAKRLAKIFSFFGDKKSSQVHNEAISVYTARSALLHGAWSPRDENASELAALAEELCYFCILCMGELFPAVAQIDGDISPEGWEKIMRNLSRHGSSALEPYGLVSQ